MRYVLSLPVSTIIIGCDTVAQLEENVALATAFRRSRRPSMRALEKLTASYETEAAWFKKDGAGWARPGDDDQNAD